MLPKISLPETNDVGSFSAYLLGFPGRTPRLMYSLRPRMTVVWFRSYFGVTARFLANGISSTRPLTFPVICPVRFGRDFKVSTMDSHVA